MSATLLELEAANLPLDLTEIILVSQGGNPRRTTIGNLQAALLGDFGEGFLDKAAYDPAEIDEQLVGLTAVQTLTNKTLTAPVINSPALSADSIDALDEIAAALKTGADAKLVTGTAGGNGRVGTWNGDGDLIDGGATIAEIRARASHTGTQLLATISDAGALAALDDLSSFDADDLDASATRLWLTTTEQAKIGHLTVTQATDLDAIRTKAGHLTVTAATDLDDIRAKAGHISITQAVDLDAIETRVNALDAAVVLAGTWDASSGSFPGGGTAQAGASYIVSVGGTVDGAVFVANDRIIAIVDNASTATYAANWHKLDYTDAVLSVAGRTGAVTIALADITDMSANGRSLTALTYANMRAALDLEPGTDFYSIAAANAAIAAVISDTAYNATSWNGVTTIAPSKNAVRDQFEVLLAAIPAIATAADWRTGTDTAKALGVDATWDAAAEVTLTDAATVAVDFATGINFVLTVTDDRTLGNPTNEKVGQSGYIRIVQGAGAPNTLAYDTDWEFAGGSAPVLSTGAAAEDLLFYQVIAANRVFASLVKAIA